MSKWWAKPNTNGIIEASKLIKSVFDGISFQSIFSEIIFSKSVFGRIIYQMFLQEALK